MRSFRVLLLPALLSAACSRVQFADSPNLPPIRPDYAGVTVPDGIAPLRFDLSDGRRFSTTEKRVGDTLFVTVSAWEKGSRTGVRYAPFPIYLSHDPIDPYIAYRLIQPAYESWREMGLYARELSSYSERPIVTNAATGGGCVNCHHFPGGDPARMLFHARGKGGGTVFLENGRARILNLAGVGPHKQGTYPAWHPSGRWVAFSSNSTQQSFPVASTQPIEVYDHFSDLILMDLQTDSVTVCSPVEGREHMETFPAWSPDGQSLYFCSADSSASVVENRARIHYALKALDFKDGSFTGEPRTVWESDSLSISFPRPCGHWMLLTVSAYGTFPIWHREADLWLMDTDSGQLRPADELNSDDTESYHAWSSNGKWVIFSSRRLDGRYTRLYIAHFDGEGHFGKPFLLPQKKMSHNDLRLRSYNVPEFVQGDPGRHDRQVRKLFPR